MIKIEEIKRILKKHDYVFAILILYFILNLFNIACFLKYLIGISCPFCGMSRAILALVQLDFKSAFYYHPLFWFILPSIFFIIHSPKPLFGNKTYQTIYYFISGTIIVIVYIIRLFILKSSIININFSNSILYLLIKNISLYLN